MGLNEFEESIVQRLERIATAVEKQANVFREDLDFRQDQAVKAEADRTRIENLLLPAQIPQGSPRLQERRRR